MSARLSSALLVSALRKQMDSRGGSAMVLARGDDGAGAVVLVIADRGTTSAIVERVWQGDGRYAWTPVGPKMPADALAISDYFERRRRSDPDLWIVELDHPEALVIADAAIAG